MSWKNWILGSLLLFSTLLTLLSSIAIAIMKDTYQRLHYSTLVVGLSGPLLVMAVWVDTQNIQARVKVILIVMILFITNGIINHATAGAYKIKTQESAPGEEC